MSSTPTRRRSAVDEAVDELRGRILHGALAPGAVVSEAKLASSLGVSRPTVREALGRLAASGLLRMPHSGTKRVLDYRDHAGLEVLQHLAMSPEGTVNTQVVRSLVEARGAIAPDVARLAAIHRSDAQAWALVAHAATLRSDAMPDAQLEPVMTWWRMLVVASDNLAYRLAFNTLRNTGTGGAAAFVQVFAPELADSGAYGAIAQHVLQREPDAAAAACRDLIAVGTRAILNALSALEGVQP